MIVLFPGCIVPQMPALSSVGLDTLTPFDLLLEVESGVSAVLPGESILVLRCGPMLGIVQQRVRRQGTPAPLGEDLIVSRSGWARRA